MKSQMEKYIEVTAAGSKHISEEKGVALASIAVKQEAPLAVGCSAGRSGKYPFCKGCASDGPVNAKVEKHSSTLGD